MELGVAEARLRGARTCVGGADSRRLSGFVAAQATLAGRPRPIASCPARQDYRLRRRAAIKAIKYNCVVRAYPVIRPGRFSTGPEGALMSTDRRGFPAKNGPNSAPQTSHPPNDRLRWRGITTASSNRLRPRRLDLAPHRQDGHEHAGQARKPVAARGIPHRR